MCPPMRSTRTPDNPRHTLHIRAVPYTSCEPRQGYYSMQGIEEVYEPGLQNLCGRHAYKLTGMP